MKTIEFVSEDRVFTNEKGQSIDYTARIIVIDGIPFKIGKMDAKVFDLQFRDFINKGPQLLSDLISDED